MKRHALRALAIAGTLAVAFDGVARADVVLAGPDSNDGSYSTAALSNSATGADTISAGGLTGISLWGFLGGANAANPTATTYGAITTSTPVGENGKNAILRYYLVATNATGQQSVVSLGEIDPNFGGASSSPAPFLAFKNTGGSGLATPELILPNQPGRDLSNVTGLSIQSAPAVTGPGGASTAIQLSGDVTAPGSYNLAALQAFTPFSETVASAGDTYTGVPLWTFLGATGGGLNQIVVTQGSDGYEVVLALAELDPSLGAVACGPGVTTCDILPYADTGTNFTTSNDGVARTIYPGDTNAHGRWESNLDVVTVTEVPEPASLTLLAFGLAAMGPALRRPAYRGARSLR